MSRPTVTLSARQQLAASPRLQQALRLLQLSAIDLADELRLAVASNPFLEDDEPVDTPEPVCEVRGAEPPRTADGERAAGTAAEWVSAEPSLHEHLRWQLYASPLSARERLAAEIVIESLDEDGYLRDDVAATAATLDVQPALAARELEQAIRCVQDFDPAGVAARNLSECLALQLLALDGDCPARPLALVLVREHLEALARHEYAALSRALASGEAQLRAAHALIRRLDPHPGLQFVPERAVHVTPDVIVSANGRQWMVSTNPAVLPRVRLNLAYAEAMQRARGGSALGQQLQEARWMLRNVEQRLTTIRRVAETIVRRQHSFFAYGDIALRPLLMREVADELGLHESTISRATAQKYMSTPQGLYRFSHFFSRQLATRSGGSCSAIAVQSLIREMIASERRDEPLSDVALAEMLNEQGIRVARRTVAKYRGLLKLPPAELRRRN